MGKLGPAWKWGALLLLAGASTPPPRLLGVDHLPVAVRDLDAAERQFRALGFTLKPGRAHADGIRNAHAKFADGTYIELITAPRATDALTAHYRAFLEEGDGAAFLSLYVPTLDGLAAALRGVGAREEEGTVDFASGPLAFLFFGTHEASPTDRPDYLVHANGALGVSRVWLAPDDPAPLVALFRKLGVPVARHRVCLFRCVDAQTARAPHGEIVLLYPEARQIADRPIVAATVRVRSLAAARAWLAEARIPVRTGADGSLLVAPGDAAGLQLQFAE